METTFEVEAKWSPWAPFAEARETAPRAPGVYVSTWVDATERSSSTGCSGKHDAVVAALDGVDVPTHSALSFVDAEWPILFANPLQLRDVLISWPKKLAELIDKPGSLDAITIESVARLLAERLPASR